MVRINTVLIRVAKQQLDLSLQKTPKNSIDYIIISTKFAEQNSKDVNHGKRT